MHYEVDKGNPFMSVSNGSIFSPMFNIFLIISYIKLITVGHNLYDEYNGNMVTALYIQLIVSSKTGKALIIVRHQERIVLKL